MYLYFILRISYFHCFRVFIVDFGQVFSQYTAKYFQRYSVILNLSEMVLHDMYREILIQN